MATDVVCSISISLEKEQNMKLKFVFAAALTGAILSTSALALA
ncbi:hypothetical protein [Sulfuriferula sp. AH1]|nr:hypothetical protein [Sulfuriferula sp. AH1]